MEKKKLILLDDQKYMLISLAGMFKNAAPEYEVAGFTSARDALRELDKGNCFAFITDMMMPDISGDQVVDLIRRKYPEQACVVITGYPDRQKIRRVVSAGNTTAILLKPLDFNQLLSKLKELGKQQEPEEEVFDDDDVFIDGAEMKEQP